jgi:hypothetical protein
MASSSARGLAAAVVLALGPSFAPLAARADSAGAPPTEDQVEAGRELYRQARELQQAGKAKEALERSLEAYRVAPTPVTGLFAALLLEQAGRLVEARETARAVGGMAPSPRETDKGRDARQQAGSVASSLDARIPKIAVAGQPAGTQVLLDGRALAASDSGAWRGVDPGVHALVVKLGDRTCTTVHLTLGEGEERTLDLHDAGVACQGDAGGAAGPAPAPPPQQPASTRPPPPPPAAPPATEPPGAGDGAGTWRIAGIGLTTAGVVTVAVGGALALSAKHDYDAVAGECSPVGCTQDGFDARNAARSRGDVASAVMGIGAAVAVGGALLWIFAPTTGDAHVAVGPGSIRVTF